MWQVSKQDITHTHVDTARGSGGGTRLDKANCLSGGRRVGGEEVRGDAGGFKSYGRNKSLKCICFTKISKIVEMLEFFQIP